MKTDNVIYNSSKDNVIQLLNIMQYRQNTYLFFNFCNDVEKCWNQMIEN